VEIRSDRRGILANEKQFDWGTGNEDPRIADNSNYLLIIDYLAFG
jgi:hypothetical protein